MDSSIVVIEMKDELPIQNGTKSVIDIKVEKELLDTSENETIEIKVDVPIQKGIKSANEFKVKKGMKDGFNAQNGIVVINELDLPVTIEIQDDFNPNIEVKKEVPVPNCDVNEDNIIEKSNNLYYCNLCKVKIYPVDEHLSGKKHIRKLREKSTMPQMNSTNFIITDPTQMPYYCALCEVSNSCQKNLERHQATKKHQNKANTGKEKAKENEFQKGATLFMEGFKHDSKNKANTENVKMPYYCALCDLQGNL